MSYILETRDLTQVYGAGTPFDAWRMICQYRGEKRRNFGCHRAYRLGKIHSNSRFNGLLDRLREKCCFLVILSVTRKRESVTEKRDLP